jgi:integrase/recombinase XerD
MNADLTRLKFPRAGLLADVRPWLKNLVARKYQRTTIVFLYKNMVAFAGFVAKRARHRRARDVTPADLDAYQLSLINRQLSPATQENYLQTVKSFFAWQEKRGAIFTSPALQLKIPRRHQRLQKVPSETEMVRLIESVPLGRPTGQRDRALIEVAYGSGLRLRELTQLDLNSLDLEGGLIRVLGKGEKERILPLTRAAVEAVRAYLANGREQLLRGRKDEPAIWITQQWPRRLGYTGVQHAIIDRATQAGLDLSPHDLRRAFATHLLLRGVSPAVLKELLGHSTYSHLAEYLRYVPTDLIEIHRRCRPSR